MNTRLSKLASVFAVIAMIAILAPILFAGTVTEPTTFRDRVMFRGSTGPDFDADNKFSIGGAAVTVTAAEINAAGSESALLLTNVVNQTATLSGTVTAQRALEYPVTNVVPQYAVYADTNGAIAITNIVLQYLPIKPVTNVSVSVAGVVTNVAVQR